MTGSPDNDKNSDAADSWRVRITVLTVAHVVGTMQSVSVFAMAPVIREDLQLSIAQVGLFVSSYYFAQMCCALPAGIFVDRLGVARALAIAHGLLAGGSVCLVLADSLLAALFAMAMMGVGYAIVNPATALGVVDWFPVSRRATVMGVKQTGVPIGGVLAAILAMLLAWLTWRQVMLVVAVLTLAHLACCLLLRPTAGRSSQTRGFEIINRVNSVFAQRSLRKFATANIFLQIGQGNFFAYLTLFLRDVIMVNQSTAAMGMAVAQISSAVGRVGWGVLCDAAFRLRRVRLVIILCALAVMGFLCFAVLSRDHLMPAMLLCAFLGATIAAFAGLMLTVAAESVEAPLAATAVGFNLSAVYLGGVLGPPLFGLAIDTFGGYRAGWFVTAACVVFGTLLLLPRWQKDSG